jgi:predicted Zn-dependent protease
MVEQGNNSEKLTALIQKELTAHPGDTTLRRFSIIALIKSGKYSQAAQESAALCEQTKSASDYALHAEALIKLGDFQGAYSALKIGYDSAHDEDMADRLALIMYTHLGQKKEAIAFLKEHISGHGNSKVVGKRLASFYADSGQLDDAALLYEQTYELSNDPLIAQEAIKIYVYQQNIPKLNAILEKSGLNDPALLELYVRDKQFAKASELAQKLYKVDQNPLYLAQSAVFAYEAAENKNDPLLLNDVVDGLKRANSELKSPLYANYLGYLMIDHDIDIDGGMEYVKKALVAQPESPYYIDSLAWGYYKKGECAEALRLMKQVESMIGTDEPEVKDHLKAIEACKTKEKK